MMNCPNCGTAEKARVKVCPQCNQAYATQDLLEMSQLEYLIKETRSWPIANSTRAKYETRLKRLQDRLTSPAADKAAQETEPITTSEEVKPIAIIKNKTKVFAGPGSHHPNFGYAASGKKYKLLGLSQDKGWWAIEIPTSYSPDGQGWVRAADVIVENWQNVPVIQAPSETETPAEAAKPEPAPPKAESPPIAVKPEPAPQKEKVPFDQWLLSERNIKIALYSGGLLLLIAGMIFIGVNWTRIPGPGKFAITLLITGLMYLGGYLLFQRPAYRIGGVALLGIASGFFVLNFAVLQIYVMGPRGVPDDVMWMIASPFCLLLYALTAYWTKSDLFTYFSMVAVGSLITAGLVVAGAPELAFPFAFACLGLLFFFLARGLQSTKLASYTFMPLMIVSHIIFPLTYLAAFVYILAPFNNVNPWFALPILALGIIFYILNSLWNRRMIFSFASLGSLAGFIFAFLFLIQIPWLAYLLVFSVFAFTCMILERIFRDTSIGDITRIPLLATSQVVIPVVIFLAVAGWLSQEFITENPWLALITLGVAVLFYMTTDLLYKRLEARWAAAILFPVTIGMAIFQLDFSSTAMGITLMVLALIYLGLGYALERREDRRAAGWPLFATAYALAGLVTFLAIPDQKDLAIILFADVALLVVSAAIHRIYWWVYGAVWMFMLPVYLTINLYVPELQYQGLLMGVLGLNYAVVGYILGRRELAQGGPFLTAAAFLSVVTVGLTWMIPLTASLVLITVAVLYVLVALWLRWAWLLLPALIAVNLGILTVNTLLFNFDPSMTYGLVISYATLGVILTVGAVILRRTRQDSWSWPLYLVGAVDLFGAYAFSLVLAGWLEVGISIGLAMLLFSLAWLEREFIQRIIKFPLLTYLGIGVVFIGHFYVLLLLAGEGVWDYIWLTYTAGLCAIFTILAWLLRRDNIEEIYSIPLRWSGLCLMAIPLVGSLVMFMSSLITEPNAVIVAVTFSIAGFTFAGDALIRRSTRESYLGLSSLMIVVWAVLYALEIFEPQAYIMPVGLSLLGIGWYERSRGGQLPYKILTYAGLILLMGSTFIQSIPSGAFVYAILLGIESLLAIGWGIRSHCRCYIQVGGLAFIANTIVQLGPGFIELPRWIQIGLTGVILLGGGMAALFKREEILNTRQRLSDEWRQWNP